MIREMTLGQYYKADSILHRLDPRVKLFGTILFVITLFFSKSLLGILCASLFLWSIVLVSKVPVKMVIRGVKPLFIIICFSAIMNACFTKGTVLFSFWIFQITKEGLWVAFYLILRLVYLVIGSSIMTFTTTPNQLTDGLEKSFHFLNFLHIPVHEIAMMMSIALRFIPILTEELDKIMKAQLSRGADFTSGNLIERGKKMIPLLIPLFLSAIRRASDLAFAMDARCYHGGDGRTKFRPLFYQKRDIGAYLLLLAYFAGMLFCGFVFPAPV